MGLHSASRVLITDKELLMAIALLVSGFLTALLAVSAAIVTSRTAAPQLKRIQK